jgi:hypothetical protein
MKTFALSVAAWLTIATTVALLAYGPLPVADVVLFILPPIAAALTVLSRGWIAASRATRIIWWLITLTAWLGLAVLTIGHWQNAHCRDDRQQLLLSSSITLFVAGWLAIRIRAFPSLRTLLEGGAAAVVIVLGIAGVAFRYEYRTRQIEAEALARWAAIGRPMDRFEKTLTASEENAALSTFGEVLLQQVNSGLYKITDADADEPKPSVPQEVIDVISRTLPPADQISPDGKATPTLDSRTEQLDAAYARILAQEAPTWAANPADSWRMRVPNFLGLRMFTQLVRADAVRRLERGDLAGAGRALAAAHRAHEKLPENPALVSLMIRIAIDAMLVSPEAWLPAETGALEAIAADATRLKAALLRSLQLEAWCFLRDHPRFESLRPAQSLGIQLSVPEWVDRWLTDAVLRRESALAALSTAENVAILQDAKSLAQPDLGLKALEEVTQRIPSQFAPRVTRALLRIHATLLLREQSALLRLAREHMASGQPLEPRDSVVLPGRRWHFTADPVAHTVALRLDQIPTFITEQVVTDQRFWILPLDGSKSWQFRPPTRAAQR